MVDQRRKQARAQQPNDEHDPQPPGCPKGRQHCCRCNCSAEDGPRQNDRQGPLAQRQQIDKATYHAEHAEDRQQEIGQAMQWNGAPIGACLALRGLLKQRSEDGRPRHDLRNLGKNRGYQTGLQRFDDGVVHQRPYLLDGLRTAVGPGAIGEQRHAELAVGIDPQRSAGEAEVPERPRGEMRARRGWL